MVLPGGGSEIAFADSTGLVATVYKGENGYAVQVAPSGFDGAIDMMVGIDNEGNVLLSNVRFAGRILGGYDFAAEKSGHGVALATGWHAGMLAGKE